MSYFDLDPAGTESVRQNARLNPINPGDMGPGFWTGSGTATVKGLAQGMVAQPALLLADTATPALLPGARKIDELFGGIGAEDWLKAEQQKTVAAVHGLMPGPQTGLLGNIGYGFGSMGPQAVAGFALGGPAGAAATVGSLQGYAAKRVGETFEGLDENTATLKGAIEGAFAAAGVALPPAFGTGIGTMVATGVFGNVGLGVAQRGATSALLESQGYDKLAEQYKAFDLSQMAVDAVLGAAFGGIHAKFGQAGEAPAPAKIPPTLTDEVLAENKQNHLQVSVAPGVPADPQSRSLHGRAVDKAMRDIMGDEPVDVSGVGIENAAFVPNRAVQEARVEAAIRADGPPLRTALDEIDQLRARAEELGIVPADEALFEGRRLVDEVRDAVEAGGARDLPGSVAGRAGEVFVGDRREPVRFVLVEADALAATIGKADNQFRDRTRAASQQQVAKIANDLQFGRLGEAPTMAEGAPTVAQSGEVVGGNGRVAAVQQAYARGLGEGYRVALEQRAAEFGLTADQVQGFSRPLLVRQFTNPVDVRTAAILSNESAGLRMSALEQAKVDAERMPAMPEMPESGDLGAASLRQFVNQWLARYPQGELGEFVDAAGKLSPQGERRLQNAILYRAYGDTPTLARLVEATDDLSRNLSGALVKSAANVAEARDLIASGDLHDLDVQPQLLQAVDTLQRLRADGTKLDDFLAQEDMFGSGIGPEAVLLMQHFQANARSQKAMVAALTGYYDAVRALGDPKQASMFDAQPPSRGELLRAVLEGRAADATPRVEESVLLSVDGGIDTVRAAWDAAGISHSISEGKGVITLSKIVVPKDAREAGAGTAAMQSLLAYADSTGQRIVLTPASDFGGSKARLVKFYKRFGFVENKGRAKDYTTREAMYRDPDHEKLSADGGGVAKTAPQDDTPVALPDVSDADKQTIASLGDRILRSGVRGFDLAPATSVLGRERARDIGAATELAARVFGKRVLTVDQPGLRLFNGLFSTSTPDVIFLDARSDKPAMAVIGHELTHALRQDRPDLYVRMLDDMREILQGKDAYAAEINAKREAKGMKPLDDNILTEEVLADVAGDQFMEPKFWKALEAQNPNRFKAIAKAVSDFLLDTLIKIDGIIAATGWRPFGSERLVSDLDRARKAVAKAFADYSAGEKEGVDGDVRLSIDDVEVDTTMASRSSEQALEDTPNLRVMTDQPYPTNARLELEKADNAVELAKNDASGIEAAAACALR